MPFAARPVPSIALLLAACSSSSTGSGTAGSVPSERDAFSYVTNLIPVQLTYGGVTGTGFVDTGNPWVLLDPGTFRSASTLPADGGDVSSLTIGAQAVSNVYVVPSDLGLSSPDPAFPIHANVGCSAVCGLVATFNYRDVAFGLGSAAPSPPSALEPEVIFDFSLEGGSQIDGVAIPRSRVVVTVALEGHDYSMILDSGATTVTVSQAAYTTLTADGRTQISGGAVETTSGTSTAMLTRAATITVGGVTVSSIVVAHDSAFDTNLEEISTDVGYTIDGSLGGNFLHDFYVTIDYPANKVRLARYSDLSFALDPAERIGIELAQDGSDGYVVGAVSTTAAAQGASVGEEVVSVDGGALAGLDAAQAAVLLYGAVGAIKQVALRTSAVAAETIAIPVEEMLPL